jgi:flagellar biosynthesis/type III secretory pathway chaperone
VAKYYALIAGAVTDTDSAESRRAIYDQARTLQMAQLRKVEPPLNDSEIEREYSSLEQAIQKVEQEAAGSLRAVRTTVSSASRPLLPTALGGSNMRRLLTRLMIGVIVLQTILLIWFLATSIPTTPELDADLDQVRDQIKQASIESDKYAPSAMKSLLEVRKQTLLNTEAMLSQKRASIIRRISLSFEIDGTQLHPAGEKELNDIKEEIGQAEKKLAQSVKNASQYTGGLVQAMALMTVGTNELAISQLRLKFYSAKYGLPLFFPQMDAVTKQPTQVPGVVVKDRDAL